MNKDMTPEELLALAQGATPQAQQMQSKQQLIDFFLQPFEKTSSGQKQFISRRRVFRRTMFAIRRKLHYNQTDFTPEELAVKEIVDARLDPNRGLTWEQFTFLWDVSPDPQSPGKIILKSDWFKEGGAMDEDVGAFYPSGFTQQGI